MTAPAENWWKRARVPIEWRLRTGGVAAFSQMALFPRAFRLVAVEAEYAKGAYHCRNALWKGGCLDILLLVALILLNGVFAMAEIALVTARKGRLRRLADAGDRAAQAALQLGQEPTRFLSTIQIGITVIGLLNGIVGESALAGRLAVVLAPYLPGRAGSIVATAIVVVCITYFSIVVGELVPKRLAQHNAEAIARRIARPINFLAILSRPFVHLLSVSTDAILGLMGKKDLQNANLTEEDIQAVLADGSQAGVIEKTEHEMVRNVFRLDDRQISSLMTPRSEIVYFDLALPFDEIVPALIESNHSRFPVCRGGLHDVVGIISAKRLLRKVMNAESDDITAYLQPAVFVPETLTGMTLLEQFRESGVKMVFVADEYGEVLGIITIQNLLEALAGEFKPRDPEDVWAVRREDGSWLLDGLIPIPELKDRLELRSVPDEDKGRYNTLGGMMMWLLGNIPKTSDAAVWESWRLEVMDMDGIRIDKVLATHVDDNPQNTTPPAG